jgi:hypothetical protein
MNTCLLQTDWNHADSSKSVRSYLGGPSKSYPQINIFLLYPLELIENSVQASKQQQQPLHPYFMARRRRPTLHHAVKLVSSYSLLLL